MKKIALLLLTLCAAPAFAGTANTLPKFQSSSTITDSQVKDDGTGVGVGTAPVSGIKLAVNGKIKSLSGGFVFPDGTTQTTAGSGGGGGGGGSLTISTPIAGGSVNTVLYEDANGTLAVDSTNLTYSSNTNTGLAVGKLRIKQSGTVSRQFPSIAFDQSAGNEVGFYFDRSADVLYFTMNGENAFYYSNRSSHAQNGELHLLHGDAGQFAAVGTYESTPGDIGNTNASTTTLYGYTGAGNSNSTNGSGYFHDVGGIFAANANNKRLTVYYGTTLLLDTGYVAFNNASWSLHAHILRRTQTTERACVTLNTSSALLPSTVACVDAAEDTSLSLTFAVKGQGTATNDIVYKVGTATWLPY